MSGLHHHYQRNPYAVSGSGGGNSGGSGNSGLENESSNNASSSVGGGGFGVIGNLMNRAVSGMTGVASGGMMAVGMTDGSSGSASGRSGGVAGFGGSGGSSRFGDSVDGGESSQKRRTPAGQPSQSQRPQQQMGTTTDDSVSSVIRSTGQTGPTSSFAFSPDPLNRYLAFFSVSHGTGGVASSSARRSSAGGSSSSNNNRTRSPSPISSRTSSWSKHLNARGSGAGSSSNLDYSSTAGNARTSAVTNATSAGSGGGSERKLCAVDMLPFMARRGLIPGGTPPEDAIRNGSTTKPFQNNYSTLDNMSFEGQPPMTASSYLASGPPLSLPITDPRIVAREHVFPLLATTSSSHVSSSTTKSTFSSSSKPGASTEAGGSVFVSLDGESDTNISLQERLRRERQRVPSSGVTQFSWSTYCGRTEEGVDSAFGAQQMVIDKNHDTSQMPVSTDSKPSFNKWRDGDGLRILIPLRGNIYVQDGVESSSSQLRCIYDKTYLEDVIRNRGRVGRKRSGGSGSSRASRRRRRRRRGGDSYSQSLGGDASAIDPQLSPDGSMVAFVVAGEIYVSPAHSSATSPRPVRVTYGALNDDYDDSDDSDSDSDGGGENDTYDRCVTHGLADFVSQEEMDRYRGYWWTPSGNGIVFTRVDESRVPPYRITHQGRDGPPPHHSTHSSCSTSMSGDNAMACVYEDHRYPFAGQSNPSVQLGYVPIPFNAVHTSGHSKLPKTVSDDGSSRSVDGMGDSTCDMESDDVENKDSASTSSELQLEKRRREAAKINYYANVKWFDAPPNANEYLARVSFLPDGSICAQWQNRSQTTLVLLRIEIETGRNVVLLTEKSDLWINLHHLMRPLPRVYPPPGYSSGTNLSDGGSSLPKGSFSFLFGSERSGFCHLYLYTYVAGSREGAELVRAVSGGDWLVESIVGVDCPSGSQGEEDVIYVTGTYDSPLERHLYALPLTWNGIGSIGHSVRAGGGESDAKAPLSRSGPGAVAGDAFAKPKPRTTRFQQAVMSARGFGVGAHVVTAAETTDPNIPPNPIRLTRERGMHYVTMDASCRIVVDSSSDLDRPSSVKVFSIRQGAPFSFSEAGRCGRDASSPAATGTGGDGKDYDALTPLFTLHDASFGGEGVSLSNNVPNPPELLSFPSSDGTVQLHAALYLPDREVHGPGPYPLACAVYGGPHVQHVHRSFSQCTDMRAQRLRSLGIAVVKCDNRGSSRRGLAFEGAIKRRLGRLEVLDQVAAVKHLVKIGVVDRNRVGIYGWSYGGYLALMCLCRAPDVFHVAVAGAPVTSWDGYDTHYTERYMGTPQDNPSGYRESAIFDHVANMRGKLMLVHGLIDENVHFRHTARLINRLIAAGKDYDLLLFPDERHSPRRVRDRIYMEQRISDYFVRHLLRNGADGNVGNVNNNSAGNSSGASGGGGGVRNFLQQDRQPPHQHHRETNVMAGSGSDSSGLGGLGATSDFRPMRGNL